MSQDRYPAADRDLVEQLLDEVVALASAEQKVAFEALLVQHPEHAIELRQRYALFQRLAALAPEDCDGEIRARHFGEYELVRELGRGGMGIVYLARQRRGEQERLIALKVVLDRGAFSVQARERLRREGAAAFRLDHPGICQVLDVGEVDGTPYLTMRYVPGATLAERIAAARAAGASLALPSELGSDHGQSTSSGASSLGGSRAAVALMEQVARALHVAHEAGFVHRDVKPGNIMVTPEGQAVLLDFGLVRDEASDHGLTLTGQPIGTPAYMSPEQIEPRGRRIDRTTDIYSLGVTLYETLALRQPFEGRTREALFRDILSRRAEDLRKFAPFVSRDLAVVVATAIDPEPQRRYATAADFAEDLRRARTAQPIVAKPASVARRLQLWCKRNPLASAVLLLLMVAVALNVGFAMDARQHARAADAARARAVEDFASAREAVSELVNIARIHLSDVPWLEPVRREVLERALAFHRGFLARAVVTPELRRDVAITKVECAGVLTHLGDGKAGQALLDEALPELLALARAGDVEAVSWVAKAQMELAQVATLRGDAGAAVDAFRIAIVTLQGLASSRPLRSWEAVTLSTSQRNLAESLQDRGELAEASTRIDAAMAIPEVPTAAFALERARLLGQRARLRRVQLDFEGAKADLGAGETLLRRLREGNEYDRDILSALAVNRMAEAVLCAARDDAAGAIIAYAEARTLLEDLVAKFPKAATDRANLATVLGAQASLLLRNGESVDAAQLQRAVELMQEMVAQDPANVARLEGLALTQYQLAQALRHEDAAQSIVQYRAALAGVEHCLELSPGKGSARDLAWRTANSLGAVLASLAQDAEAGEAWDIARRHGAELLQRDPEDVRWLRGQAILLCNEGTLACETGDLEAAAALLEEALALDVKLLAKQSQDARTHADHHRHLVRAAQIASVRGVSAEQAWRRAAAAIAKVPPAILNRLAEKGDSRGDLATIEQGVGAILVAAGEVAPAGEALDRAAHRLAGMAPNLANDVERLLLALANVQRFQSAGDGNAAATAARSLLDCVNAVTGRLGASRLQAARLRAALPRFDALTKDLHASLVAEAGAVLRRALDERR